MAQRRDSSGSLMARYTQRLGVIGERRHAEAALRQARHQAEVSAQAAHEAMLEAQAANRTKTQFLANMSHELRTPLNAIIGFSDVLVSNEPPMHKIREYARDIHVSGEHLLSLINDILDLARIEAGKMELHEDAVDLSELAERAQVLLVERAREGGVDLANPEVPAGLTVYADRRKLNQILINLLSNAVKFTPAHGRVQLRARPPEGDAGLVIEVTDTGIGMAAADLDKALSPFGQVDSDLNRRYEGTGLGLPLTKALIELHDGQLALRSEPGRGTTARIEIAAARVLARGDAQPTGDFGWTAP